MPHHDPPFMMIPSAGLVGPVERLVRRVSGNGYSSGSSSSLQILPLVKFFHSAMEEDETYGNFQAT